MENKWSKYGMALVAGIPVALCLSVVCCGTSSLPADILEDDWRWMYGCGVLSLAGLALLVLLFPKRVKECLSAVVSWVFYSIRRYRSRLGHPPGIRIYLFQPFPLCLDRLVL